MISHPGTGIRQRHQERDAKKKLEEFRRIAQSRSKVEFATQVAIAKRLIICEGRMPKDAHGIATSQSNTPRLALELRTLLEAFRHMV